MPNWLAAAHTELARLLIAPQHAGLPPPPQAAVSGARVSNSIVWWLAATPLAFSIVTVGMPGVWWLNIVINIVLCHFDNRELEKAGYPDVRGYVFLVPLYLFKRAEMLRETPHYAWLWVASFVLSLLFVPI